MKSAQKLFASAFVLFGIYFFSCTKSDSDTADVPEDEIGYTEINGKKAKIELGPNTKTNSYIIESALFLPEENITLPIGTKIEKDPSNSFSFTYTLPENYLMIGQNARGQSAGYTTGSITCTCTKGFGCNPYIATLSKLMGGGTYTGCVMVGNCTACARSKGARVASKNIEIRELDIIDFSLGIHFISEEKELDSAKSIGSNILSSRQIQDSLAFFLSGFQGDNLDELINAKSPSDIPGNWVYVAVSVYGTSVLVPIDKNLAPMLTNPVTNGGYVGRMIRNGEFEFPAKTTCKCLQGSTGCKLTTRSIPGVGYVEYCEAGKCTQCKLTTS